MHRELGHIAFGNPQQFDVPDFVSDRLYDIFTLYLTNLGIDSDAGSVSYGHDFPEGMALVVRPYDWGWDVEDNPAEDMLPNVEFQGVRVWWYKYLGRGMTTDALRSGRFWRRWLRDLELYAESFDTSEEGT